MKNNKKLVKITHRQTGELIASGLQGWNFMPFEGNYYISNKYIRTRGFKFSFIPGFCIYKFLYFWLHLQLKNGGKEYIIAWIYVIPNPLFPFIWFRIGLPQHHPSLNVEIRSL